MSKSEILAELPKLNAEDRRAIFDCLCEMEERELLHGTATLEEKNLLDQEAGAYQNNPDAGSTWEEVRNRIRKPFHA
jgi:hypothetical protein